MASGVIACILEKTPKMKKKPIAILTLALSFLFWAGTTSNSLTVGYTAAPGEGSCEGCHTGDDTGINGTMLVSGLPQYLVSDTWYTVSITMTSATDPEAVSGFQFTALDIANNSFGSYSNAGPNVSFANFGSRTYAQHDTPMQVDQGTNSTTFTFDWKSPAVSSNQLTTFYWGGVLGNPDGQANYADKPFLDNRVRTVVAPVGFASIQKEDVSCNGEEDGSITVFGQGGLAPLSFEWSNGASGNSISNLDGGTYTVTVTDELGQTASTSITIGEPAQLQGTIFESLPVDCNGGTGNLSVGAGGGTPPYQYQWSDGNTGAVNTNLDAGIYAVTITDANGCQSNDAFQLEEPAALNIVPFVQNNVSCAGEDDGLIQVSASGGTTPYFFEWSNGTTGPSLVNVGAGNYVVTLIDNMGCETEETFTIQEPAPLVIVPFVQEDVSCAGETDGLIQVSASGGNMPYTFEWSTGATGPSLVNVGAGNYVVTLTDNMGCETQQSFPIEEPDPILISYQLQEPDCFGATNGMAQIQPEGGIPPYSYFWPDGSTEANRMDLEAGSYSVSVQDANGCMNQASFTMEQPAALALMIDNIQSAGGGQDNGAINITMSGGTPPYTYEWSTSGQGLISNEEDPAGLAPGTYYLFVSDSNGCGYESSGVVVESSTSIQYQQLSFDVVFPNPVTGLLPIQFGNPVPDIVHLHVWNPAGQRIAEFIIPPGASDYLIALPEVKGTYFLEFQQDEKKQVFPLVVLPAH